MTQTQGAGGEAGEGEEEEEGGGRGGRGGAEGFFVFTVCFLVDWLHFRIHATLRH